MTDPFGTTHYDRTGQTRIKEERPMSDDDVTERAVEMLQQAMASGAVAFVEKVRAGEVDPSAPMTEAFGDFPREFLSIRADLFDGLLVSPERDAAVAVRALRDAAADLGRRASDPALIESADRHSGYYAGVRAAMQREIQLLHDRADRIEREAGESDADA